MSSQQLATTAEAENDEINLPELMRALWQQRLIILAAVVVSLAAAIVYLNIATYTYTAELKVTPSQSSGNGRSMGGLAGLASIAGVSLGNDSGATPFQLYLEGVKSRSVAEALADRRDIMKVVFRGEWDENSGRFVERPSAVGSISRGIKNALGLPTYPWRSPDAARLHTYVQANVGVTESPKSPVVTISFSHRDPQFAVRFLNALHATLDAELRRKALVRSGSYISYLTAQLQRVTIADHREALIQALSEQEKFRMMASSDLAYAADPFGTATASIRPTSPNPIMTMALSAIMGLMLGGLVAIIRWRIREARG